MIDIQVLARGLVATARKYLVDEPGVFEVHFCDDAVSEIGPTQVWRFIKDWELADHLTDQAAMEAQQFVGIVGDGCAVLYPIGAMDVEKQQEQST
jgi:hypothetical protein